MRSIIEKLGNIFHKLKCSNGHRLTDTALKNKMSL